MQKHHGVGLMLALVNEFSSHSEGKLPATYHAKCNSSFAVSYQAIHLLCVVTLL